MKYKKQIATGALAISLLVGGSSVFAATPQDLGIKNVQQQVYQRENRAEKSATTKSGSKSKTVGVVSMISGSGFVIEVKNKKADSASSVDVQTGPDTSYTKNGVAVSSSDLAIDQKVIVAGKLDKTANVMSADKVKIVVV